MTVQPRHHNVSMVVLLDRFCEVLQLRELPCSFELLVLLFLIMLALLLINLCCLCCIFRRRLVARILLCWDMETATSHTIKEGGQVEAKPSNGSFWHFKYEPWQPHPQGYAVEADSPSLRSRTTHLLNGAKFNRNGTKEKKNF